MKLANDSIAEIKLDIHNDPSADMVLGYDATNGMTWVAQTGGGGTGDITAVTTSSTSGLSGGMNTGDVALTLDFDNLTGLSVGATDILATRKPGTGHGAFNVDALTTFLEGDLSLNVAAITAGVDGSC